MNFIERINDANKYRLIKYGKKGTDAAFSIIRIVFLLSVGFVIIYPLFYMVVTSLQGRDAFVNSMRVWIPIDFNIKENYRIAFVGLEYGKTLWSTLKNEILSALIEVCTCAVAAYGLARFDFKEKRLIIAIVFLKILVPDMVLMVPRVINYTRLDFFGILGVFEKLTTVDLRPNIYNTSWSLWLPSLFAMGLRSGILIYIYMQFFKGLPRELEEAAWIDGAGPIRTFIRIAIPSSGVVILTVLVFSLIWHWNDINISTIFLRDEPTLATALSNLSTSLSAKFGIENDIQSRAYLMAGCVLFITPMLVFYMIVQRWFIESIDRVGITG